MDRVGGSGSGNLSILSISSFVAPAATFFACCRLIYASISSSPNLSSSSTEEVALDNIDPASDNAGLRLTPVADEIAVREDREETDKAVSRAVRAVLDAAVIDARVLRTGAVDGAVLKSLLANPAAEEVDDVSERFARGVTPSVILARIGA